MTKKMSDKNTGTLKNASSDWSALTGPLPFRMTNDLLFKILLQNKTSVLKALICSYLDLSPSDIKDVCVTNTISLKEDILAKEMILDIKAQMNDDTIVNLEMQVLNNRDWPERSISYACRCFDHLQKGQGYRNVKGVAHIGFLDYTLFPNAPEFFATYLLSNVRTGQVYSSKFQISVVDLTHINLATEEDRQSHRSLWASFFKAKSWEELIMLAQQDKHIKEAVATVNELSQDELFRQRYEAQEDWLRQQIDHDTWYKNEIKKTIAEKNAALAEKDATIAASHSENERLRNILVANGINPDQQP